MKLPDAHIRVMKLYFLRLGGDMSMEDGMYELAMDYYLEYWLLV